jgi:ATP-dependent RNA helicase DHX8/PRP22
MHEQSKGGYDEFARKLSEIGADFPDSFIKNLDRLIVTMHPKYKRKAAKAKAKAKAGNVNVVGTEEQEVRARKFPGLSMPDQGWKSEDKYLADREVIEGKETHPDFSLDKTMADLEAVAARRGRASADDYMDGQPSAKRARQDDRGRDYDQDQGYGRDRGYDRDRGYGRERSPDPGYGIRDDGWAGRGGQSAPPDRDDRGRGGYGGRPGRDDTPVQYKIYDGTVTSVKDFGAFVALEGIAGRVEGRLEDTFTHC